jgi:hypothetical protein
MESNGLSVWAMLSEKWFHFSVLVQAQQPISGIFFFFFFFLQTVLIWYSRIDGPVGISLS